MTERVSSQVFVAEMELLRRIHGVALRDKVCSCIAMNVEQLLWIQRLQLWGFSYVARKSRE